MNKYTILVIALCTLASAVLINGQSPPSKPIREAREKCGEEIGVEVVDGHLKNPKGPNSYCFRRCMLKQLDVLDADGGLNRDGTLQMIAKKWPNDEEKLKKANLIIDECLKMEPEEKSCLSGAFMGICLRQKSMENGIRVF